MSTFLGTMMFFSVTFFADYQTSHVTRLLRIVMGTISESGQILSIKNSKMRRRGGAGMTFFCDFFPVTFFLAPDLPRDQNS